MLESLVSALSCQNLFPCFLTFLAIVARAIPTHLFIFLIIVNVRSMYYIYVYCDTRVCSLLVSGTKNFQYVPPITILCYV